MSCHVIIGRGNLGMDLALEIEKRGDKAVILTRKDGFKWPDSLDQMRQLDPEYIWITAGAGSVEAADKNLSDVVQTHVVMPVEIMKAFPETVKIILFSSDYVANEEFPSDPTKRTQHPRSLYALSKIWMEEAFEQLNQPNSVVIRVGSLYGRHFYNKTFPGKLTERFPQPAKVMLPTNTIVPTPTSWVAEVLVKQCQFMFIGPTKKIFHCAPKGNTTVINFGRTVLGEGYHFESRGVDRTRPEKSGLLCSFGEPPTWEDLWKSHWWSPETNVI